MNKFRDQRGQALVMSVAFLTVLLGCAALVLDVGSWYRADRHAQTAADAAALAGAQGLNESAGLARTLAQDYADKNGGGVTAADITITGGDTVRVQVNRPAPGFFAKLFGLNSVRAHAVAAARVAMPAQALHVAPIVVNEKHPDLLNFGKPTELEYYHLTTGGGGGGGSGPDGPGSFGFINLDPSVSNPPTSTMGDWIRDGFDRYMDTGKYDARTGNPFSSTHIGDSLNDRIGEELLFPIYRKLTGGGSGAKYEIVGWIGFHLTGTDLTGSNEKLYGWFTRVIWEGIQAHSGSGSYSPGVGVIELVE
jgi:Putative Flp pilus-assembly TadE/G-like